jgi:sugar-specific transcriptional regulator TrmB
MAEPIDADMLATLRRVGLTEYEARAYHALVTLGRADGATVARAAGVPPTRVHSVLRELRRKDWAAVEPGRPATFVPSPPRERLELAWTELARSYERAVGDLELAYAGRSVAASTPLWFLRDEEAIAARARDAIAAARGQVAATLPFLPSSDARELFPALARAARAGRRVRVIVAPDHRPSRARGWPALLAAGVEARALAMPVRLVAADFESVLILPRPRDESRPVAIWNPVREFVGLLRPTFEQMWRDAAPLTRAPAREAARA